MTVDVLYIEFSHMSCSTLQHIPSRLKASSLFKFILQAVILWEFELIMSSSQVLVGTCPISTHVSKPRGSGLSEKVAAQPLDPFDISDLQLHGKLLLPS